MSDAESDESPWLCRVYAHGIARDTAKQLADLQHPVQAAMMARIATVLGGLYDGVCWDAPVPPKAGPCSTADADMARWLLGKIDEIERLIPRGWEETDAYRHIFDQQTKKSLAAIRAWAVDVETRSTQTDHTEGAATMEDENKGAQEQLGEMRDAHNRALAAQAEDRKVKVAYLGGEVQVDVSEKYALEKALRAAQAEPVAELLMDAICAAESMMEHTAGNALSYVRASLIGEQVASVPPPPPETLPPWISPWEGDLARCVADKVGKALERLSQYEWARKHPSDPMKRLGAVHAWACEMMSKADHLEHNQRVVLERGRDALIQAQDYMRLAVRMILRDNVTGEQALTYDRANDAVGAALVVLCDNVLCDKKPLERRGTEPVLTRREAARRAYDALTSWLYNTAECPFDGDGARRQDLPPEATAAMYRAAWAVGHCVMRDSDSFSQVARGAVGLVREQVAGWVRSARL